MLVFQYRAKNKNAETINGKIEANTKEEAIEKINQFGLMPVLVEEEDSCAFSDTASKNQKAKSDLVTDQGSSSALTQGSVSIKELYLFSRQFASLLKAGISILYALNVLSRQTKNAHFKKVISRIRSDIQGGSSFSNSAAQYPRIFPPVYISMSRAGEEGGKLQDVIAAVSEHLKAQLEIRNKIKTALAYPILMFVFGVGAVSFILTSVMPKITNIFLETDQVLPLPTAIVMAISDLLIHWWAWILFILLVIIFILKQWFKTVNGLKFLCDLKLRTPLLGDMWLKEDLARFSRTMALLMDSGVSIVKAMRLAIPTVSNIFLRAQLVKCQEELVAGRAFGDQIKEMSLIPDIMGDLISVGEESGSLVPSLNDIADNYEQELNDYVKIMTTLFEPIMIIVIGALIGFIVIAMLLPIFQMDFFS